MTNQILKWALLGYVFSQSASLFALSTDNDGNNPSSQAPTKSSYFQQNPTSQPPSNPSARNQETSNSSYGTLPVYTAKDYTHLLGMPGFSNNALNMHFTLYQGYVKNANLLLNKIHELSDSGQQKSVEFAELKRRLGWEWDGMRLHELYFENLGGKSQLPNQSDLYNKIQQSFGNFDAWKADFVGTGLMRGIGWSILYYDPASQALINTWINEHDVGHLAGGKPILVMDVFEHAYLPDYQLDRAKYIDAFFSNIDWDTVNARFQAAAVPPNATNPAKTLR